MEGRRAWGRDKGPGVGQEHGGGAKSLKSRKGPGLRPRGGARAWGRGQEGLGQGPGGGTKGKGPGGGQREEQEPGGGIMTLWASGQSSCVPCGPAAVDPALAVRAWPSLEG